jgi:hypothetical protein
VVWRGRRYRLQVAALFTELKGLTVAKVAEEGRSEEVSVSFPPYEPPDTPPGQGGEDFRLAARCLLHLPAPDSLCLFLYKVSYPLVELPYV